MKSDNLKVVMDAANLFQINNVQQMQETMDKSFYLLGNDIVIAHAKDIKISNEDLEVVAAGDGILNYDTYLRLLQKYHFKGALILHGLDEQQVETSVDFLKQKFLSLN
ncbi:MAG: TIM barrel protein [Segetibacter sp.]